MTQVTNIVRNTSTSSDREYIDFSLALNPITKNAFLMKIVM